nr:immunoglobulin heavy chain junction region [Mus musculus]
CVRRWFDFW